MGLRMRQRASVIGLAVASATVMAALTASPATAAPTEGTIHDAGTATVVPESYVVVLKETDALRSNGVETSARYLAGKYHGQVRQVYSKAVHGFAVTMPEAQAKQLAGNPAVEYVQRNGVYHAIGTQTSPPSTGLDRIDQRTLPLDKSYSFPSVASGVHAYIIDTGIRVSHTTFGGRATLGTDTVGDGQAPLGDCNGHGTHVAGTVGGAEYGVAKGVSLVAVRVLNCSGSGTTATVVAGIDWVTNNAVKPAVANMSLGGGADPVLDAAVQKSIDAGITYSIAAGNSNADACATSPARLPAAITVGAVDQSDNRASFSNFGTCVDLFGPGVGIVSSWLTSPTATATLSGTSMATPHVTGAAALVLAADPTFTPQQVRDALVTRATTGVVANAGTGSPNRLLYVGTAPQPMDFAIATTPTSGSTAPGGSVPVTVATTVTRGTAQPVQLSASGLPAGATATFTPASVTAGGTAKLVLATSTSTPAGSYPVTITGTGTAATHTSTFSLTVTGPTGGCAGSNATDVPIPDAGKAVTSDIVIAGCNRKPATTSKLHVTIVHPYRGDLLIDLVAPNGTRYRLKTPNIKEGGANFDYTFGGDLSSIAANGTWRLQVQDVYLRDVGYLDSWSLSL